MTGAELDPNSLTALHAVQRRAASPPHGSEVGVEDQDSPPQDFCAAVVSIGDKFANKLRRGHKVTASDFMALPLDGPSGASMDQASSVDAC